LTPAAPGICPALSSRFYATDLAVTVYVQSTDYRSLHHGARREHTVVRDSSSANLLCESSAVIMHQSSPRTVRSAKSRHPSTFLRDLFLPCYSRREGQNTVRQPGLAPVRRQIACDLTRFLSAVKIMLRRQRLVISY